MRVCARTLAIEEIHRPFFEDAVYPEGQRAGGGPQQMMINVSQRNNARSSNC